MTTTKKVLLSAAVTVCVVLGAGLVWLHQRSGNVSPKGGGGEPRRDALLGPEASKLPPVGLKESVAAVTPTGVLAKVKELWGNEDFEGLQRYGETLQREKPQYMPTLVLKSFLDIVYRGEIKEADHTLRSVAKALEGQDRPPILKFRAGVETQLTWIQAEIRAHERHGTSDDMLRKNASPKKYKEAVGNGLPPLLALLEDCPNQELPAPKVVR